ncbi:MAG TPA: hypothetical protein PLL69_06520 [Gemmatimonadales bacterium]|nr:hypothetical protein [Gemmatimonadales bacterium]
MSAPLRRVKLALAVVGLVLAGVAVFTEDQRITWAAISFLAAALVIRLIDSSRPA